MSAKRVLLVVAGLIVVAVGVLYCWPPRLIDDGGFELLVAKHSPSHSKVAEVLAYRGGATVRGFSIVLVRPSDRKISPDDFSARVADCEGGGRIEVSWAGDERLLVEFPSTEHRLLKQTAFGIAIEERRRMSTYEFLDLLISLSTLALTVGGLLFVWAQIRQVKVQLCLQHFADYTKRYQEIILKFPETINEASFDLAASKEHDSVMRQMRAYADLCYEEWFLRRTFELHEGVWQTWNGGMDTAFSKRAFRDAWAVIKKDSEYGPNFREFIDEKVAAKTKG